MADDKKHDAAEAAKEQVAIFERARPILEKVNSLFLNVDFNDRLTVLWFLLAKTTVQIGKTSEEMMEVTGHNLPHMMKMWENAFSEVETEEAENETETEEEAPETEDNLN